MILKLRLFLPVMALIAPVIVFCLTYGSQLAGDKLFNQTQALSLAATFLAALIFPGMLAKWLVGNQVREMRKLCELVKQGEYGQLLALPNEAEESSEDYLTTLMRDMNWMAKRIASRERDLQKAVQEARKAEFCIAKKNQELVIANSELLIMQQRLQAGNLALEDNYKQMQKMAMTDALTGLSNRRCFFTELSKFFATLSADWQSLLMLDIDYFKKVNDVYGHQVGDFVLQELSATWRKLKVQGLVTREDLHNMVNALSKILEAKNACMCGHSERVAEVSLAIAQEVQLPIAKIDIIHIGTHLHYIGKISIHDHILNKPGKLTATEFALIKKHPEIGAKIVSQVNLFNSVIDIVRNHHERFDGKGYSDGLMGIKISQGARIVAVSDAFDAMISNRSYKSARSIEEALA